MPFSPEYKAAILARQVRQDLAMLKELRWAFGRKMITRDLVQKRLLEIDRDLKQLWRRLQK